MTGVNVKLLTKEEIGIDKYNHPIYAYRKELIPNVLISPSTADEQTETLELYNRRAVYTLAIPKKDNHKWEGQKVEFWGRTWEVVGIPLEGIEHLIPLEWNKKVRVAVYE